MRSALVPVLFGRPGWVPYGASLAFDFTKGAGWTPHAVRPAAGLLTTTRASDGWAENNAGIWQVFTSGQARITDKGLLVEEARTNVVLHNRDLTNAAWTASNVTVAKNQAGIDGVANSASLLTATDANGTVLQAITLASSARWQSAFVKRVTGSGNIDMTMDNGSTWTTVTVTSGWTRVEIATQTLANPTVGFRIVTSGDAVAVDFVQNENSGVFATSPVAVTTGAATREADVIAVASPPALPNPMTLFASWVAPVSLGGSDRMVMTVSDGTANNFNRLFISNASGRNASGNSFTGGANQGRIDAAAAFSAGAAVSAATAVALADRAISSNGGAVGTSSTNAAISGLTTINIGSAVSANYLNSFIRRVAYFPTRLTNAQLQALTI